MSQVKACIDEHRSDWLRRQPVFFVATAPLAPKGHVNGSPKGGDCFRVPGPLAVAYLDYTGSGAETAAHLQENGRIVLMFCAFAGRPEVVRLHGHGEALTPAESGYEALASLWPPHPGARAVVRVAVSRVSTSCGFPVPLMDFRQDRETFDRWALSKGEDGLAEYRREKNARRIDGLPAHPVAEMEPEGSRFSAS